MMERMMAEMEIADLMAKARLAKGNGRSAAVRHYVQQARRALRELRRGVYAAEAWAWVMVNTGPKAHG